MSVETFVSLALVDYSGSCSKVVDMSLSTSTLFADGMFTLGADIPNNFILIRQDGALKGNSLSAGRTGSSTPAELKPIFGTYLYDGLSGSGGTVLSMFSTDEDAFGGASIFDVNVYPSNLYGYTLRLSAEPRYAVLYMKSAMQIMAQ